MSKLVRDVAARLKIPDEEAELVLRALSKLIRKQAAKDGVVRVPEIGVFRMEDDVLTYEPDEQLAAIANYRYSGMKPLPALAALEGGHDAAARGLPEDLVLSLDRLPTTDEDMVHESEDAEGQIEETHLESTLEEDAPVGQAELAASVSEVLEEGVSEETGDAESEEAATTPEAKAPSSDAEDGSTSRNRPPAPPRRRDSNSTWIVIGLIVAVLLAAGGIWLVTSQQGSQESVASEETTETGVVSSAEPPEEAPASPDETSNQPEGADQEPATEDEAPQEPQVDIDVAAGGFTLIVVSRPNRSDIEAMLDDYREVLVPQGYPVGVLGPREGETRFRLGVGQFETIEDALAARDALSGQIPRDAWVYGIRPEMDPDI